MSLIRLDNVSKSFAGAPVLAGISLRIEEGEHIGLIGRNGTGKSTIFRLITGKIEPDSGTIERMRRARFACLAQLPKVDDHATIEQIVLRSFTELIELEADLKRLEDRMAEGDESAIEAYSHKQEIFAHRGGYDFRTRVKQVLQGLGFPPAEFGLTFKALSGGQRTRIMLALVLLQEADLLLLDEPENHLDLEAREWLEAYLRNSRQALVIISHDRQMLNAAVDRIVEVERCELHAYKGDYDHYLAAKALHREQQQAAYERQQEFIRKEQVWIDRFRYKATKARQAQSRIKRLEKLERIEAPPAELDAAKFSLGEVVRSGECVLDAQDLGMAYGNLTLYRNVSFRVQRGERIGIVGPNGSGKTTLLRQLAGKLPGATGEVTPGHKVVMEFYEQNHEQMNPANDVLSEVQACRPAWRPEQIRSFLGRLLFTGDDVFKKVGSLSGGELSRVAMAKLILSDANLLLLDEPTNHLDIASREALEAALAEFPGAMVLVSHDRALIDRLADRLILIENGTATVYLGNYGDYRRKHAIADEKPQEKSQEEVLRIRRGQESREAKKGREREDRRQQRKLEKLEADIEALEDLLADFDARFAAIDPADFQAAAALKTEYDGLQADLRTLYTAWEELSRQVQHGVG